MTVVPLQTCGNSTVISNFEKVYVYWITAKTLGKGWQVKISGYAANWEGNGLSPPKNMTPSCRAGSAPQPAGGGARHSAQHCTHARRNHCGNKQLLLAVSYTGKVIGKPQSQSQGAFVLQCQLGSVESPVLRGARYRTEHAVHFQVCLSFGKAENIFCPTQNPTFISTFHRSRSGRAKVSKSNYFKKERALNISKPCYISDSLLFFRFWEGPGMCLSTKSTWWH